MSEPRRPGRPALDKDDPAVGVNVRLPSKVYDRAYDLARRDRVSVPDILRRGLARVLKDADDQDD